MKTFWQFLENVNPSIKDAVLAELQNKGVSPDVIAIVDAIDPSSFIDPKSGGLNFTPTPEFSKALNVLMQDEKVAKAVKGSLDYLEGSPEERMKDLTAAIFRSAYGRVDKQVLNSLVYAAGLEARSPRVGENIYTIDPDFRHWIVVDSGTDNTIQKVKNPALFDGDHPILAAHVDLN